VVGSLSNFTINKHWAFKRSPNLLGPQLTRFVLVQAAASGWHTLGVWLLTRFVGTPYQVSKLIVAAAVGLGWNYPMNRSLVFSTAGVPEETSSSRSSPRPSP
jgi:putative flippase GtrA